MKIVLYDFLSSVEHKEDILFLILFLSFIFVFLSFFFSSMLANGHQNYQNISFCVPQNKVMEVYLYPLNLPYLYVRL